MPQLGETVTEGTITKWFKAIGDQVARDEPLFEVSTDKVDSEVPSPAEGVLSAILVEEGDTVDVGVKLAVISDACHVERPRARPGRGEPTAAGGPSHHRRPGAGRPAGGPRAEVEADRTARASDHVAAPSRRQGTPDARGPPPRSSPERSQVKAWCFPRWSARC